MATVNKERVTVFGKELTQLKTEVGATKALLDGVLPHVATKADLEQIRTNIRAFKGLLDDLTTVADLEPLQSRTEKIEIRLKRLVGREELEPIYNDIRAIKARLDAGFPHLATKADIEDIRGVVQTEVGSMRAETENTRAEVRHMVRAAIMLNIGTVIIAVVLVFIIVRFLR